jgi:hypothetical protein
VNSHEARTVLLRYRPGTADEREADVRAALDLAASDPELARWWADHRRLQEDLRAKLRAIEPPAGLREQILSERKAATASWPTSRRLAFAGSLALLAVVIGVFSVVLRQDPEAQFSTFRSRMVRTALRGYSMDLESRDPAEVRQFLAERQAHAGWQSPPSLDRQPLMGCAVLTWRSHTATMICYGQGETPELWLFVVNTSALPDPPAEDSPAFARVNRLNTLSWSRGGRTYVLASEIPADELRALATNAG